MNCTVLLMPMRYSALSVFVRAVHWAPMPPPPTPHKESVGWCLDVFSLLFILYLSTQAVEQTVKLVVNLNA